MAVQILTERCHYAGMLPTRSYRISDVLSDSSTDILEMFETQTCLEGAETADVRWRQISLRKERILMVIPAGTYEAPARRRDRYVQKPRYGAVVVLPGIVLSGVLHLPTRTTAISLLQNAASLSTFLGITEVTVHSTTHHLGATRFDTVILRRPAIESIQLTAQPLPAPVVESESPEPATATP